MSNSITKVSDWQLRLRPNERFPQSNFGCPIRVWRGRSYTIHPCFLVLLKFHEFLIETLTMTWSISIPGAQQQPRGKYHLRIGRNIVPDQYLSSRRELVVSLIQRHSTPSKTIKTSLCVWRMPPSSNFLKRKSIPRFPRLSSIWNSFFKSPMEWTCILVYSADLLCKRTNNITNLYETLGTSDTEKICYNRIRLQATKYFDKISGKRRFSKPRRSANP